jgi:hypothetical protein
MLQSGMGALSLSTRVAIDKLQNLENISFTRDQRRIIAAAIQETDRSVTIQMARRTGKTTVIKALVKHSGGEMHVVVPNHRVARFYLDRGVPQNYVHIYGNLQLLNYISHPFVVLFDECEVDDYVLGCSFLTKAIAVYTVPMNTFDRSVGGLGIDTIYYDEASEVTEEAWNACYGEVINEEKDWDNETNKRNVSNTY